jgi:hypothetical protein
MIFKVNLSVALNFKVNRVHVSMGCELVIAMIPVGILSS